METQHPSTEPVYARPESGIFSGDLTNEHRETFPTTTLAFMLIKPGFEAHLQDITAIIEGHGLQVIYDETVRLTGEAVDFLYADAMEEHHYPDMRNYLTDKDAIVMMVHSPEGDTQERLNLLKKTKDGDGEIRVKFQTDPRIAKEELEKWIEGEHPAQEELTVVLTQRNVVHTTDTPEEARCSLQLFLGDKFKALQAKGMLPSELYDLFGDTES